MPMELFSILSYSVHSSIYTETKDSSGFEPHVILELMVRTEQGTQIQQLLRVFKVNDALQAYDAEICGMTALGDAFSLTFSDTLNNRNQISAIQYSLKTAARKLDSVQIYTNQSYLQGYKVVGFKTGIHSIIGQGDKFTLSAVVEKTDDTTFHTMLLPQAIPDAIRKHEYVNIGTAIVQALQDAGMVSYSSNTIDLDVGAREKLATASQYIQSETPR